MAAFECWAKTQIENWDAEQDKAWIPVYEEGLQDSKSQTCCILLKSNTCVWIRPPLMH